MRRLDVPFKLLVPVCLLRFHLPVSRKRRRMNFADRDDDGLNDEFAIFAWTPDQLSIFLQRKSFGNLLPSQRDCWCTTSTLFKTTKKRDAPLFLFFSLCGFSAPDNVEVPFSPGTVISAAWDASSRAPMLKATAGKGGRIGSKSRTHSSFSN